MAEAAARPREPCQTFRAADRPELAGQGDAREAPGALDAVVERREPVGPEVPEGQVGPAARGKVGVDLPEPVEPRPPRAQAERYERSPLRGSGSAHGQEPGTSALEGIPNKAT